MTDDLLQELAKISYEARRETVARVIFRPWEKLHKTEQEAERAGVRAMLLAMASGRFEPTKP